MKYVLTSSNGLRYCSLLAKTTIRVCLCCLLQLCGCDSTYGGCWAFWPPRVRRAADKCQGWRSRLCRHPQRLQYSHCIARVSIDNALKNCF